MCKKYPEWSEILWNHHISNRLCEIFPFDRINISASSDKLLSDAFKLLEPTANKSQKIFIKNAPIRVVEIVRKKNFRHSFLAA